MHRYLLIQSRDPFESCDPYDLARGLAAAGEAVTVLLVQNAVLAARREARADSLDALAHAGVKVLADDFALRERAISPAQLRPGVSETSLDVVIDRLCDNARVLWQ